MLHYKNALELDLAREREKNRDGFVEKEPKDHQRRAIKKLNEFYSKTGQRGILVLPTGAGKTYTAAYWLIKQIIPKSIKILWLADQGFLLEQAYETFRANILEVPHRTRTQIRMRIVSGSPRHADGNSISIDDDILLMTAQTAVSQWQSQAIDDNGKVVQTKLHAFLEHSSKESNIFIVYDEAHHTPAFGRRNLLVGGSGNYTGILEKFPQAQLLGLTATPTYTDSTQRGWLWKIFTGGIIHSEQKATLEDAGILAAAKYQAEKTNFKFTISDSEVEQVMLNHKELPARIVDEIAKNEERNRYIAEFYLKNQKTLGKTIIFLDRWYQCRTIENKLNSMAGKQIAASVFSYVDREKSIEYINSRSSDENDKNLDLFRAGKIQILLNVKMLTEGVDVPDVNSVFITRETNSTILFTQMVGELYAADRRAAERMKQISSFYG
jgi:superfamily II DNA or RNA helicase